MEAKGLKGARRGSWLAFAAACAVFARSATFGFVQDDYPLLVENPLLRRWRDLPLLLTTGYWQPSSGAAANVSIYRPLVSLSYFLQVRVLGAPWALHAANVLLHGAVSAMVYGLLRRRLRPGAALLAALLFAVHPVQTEAVARVSSRPDLLCALFLLAAWRLLEEGRAAAGGLAYALALGSLESAAMFPAAYAAYDYWTNGSRGLRRRGRVHAALWAILAAYLALRAFLLPGPLIRGGAPYFASEGLWVKLLTLSRFWFRYYLVPLATGLGTFLDAKRPFFPDASATDPVAIALLAGWLALLAASLRAAARRRSWGFWAVFAFLFLLPTSHLLFKYDTLGAERFLYLPSLGFFAIAAEAASARIPNRASFGLAALLVGGLAARTLATEGVWRDQGSYWAGVLRDNPGSAEALDSLALELARGGKGPEAEALFRRSIELDPARSLAYYNLARLYWDESRFEAAEGLLRQALLRTPDDPDCLDLSALAAERRGRWGEAAALYRRALEVKPWDEVAGFNLERLRLLAAPPK